MKHLIEKLNNEIEELDKGCAQLLNERFSTSKHKDSWNDEIARNIIESRIRIKMLIEIIASKIEPV